MKRKLLRWYFKFHDKRLQKLKLDLAQVLFDNNKGKYCWADCVSYSFAPFRFNPFKIESSRGCEIESKEHDTNMCYCGGWENGVCYDKLTQDEKDKMQIEIKSVSKEIPF